MIIAVVVDLDLTGHGGVETHILELAAAMHKLNVQMDVFSSRPGTEGTPLPDFTPKRYDIIHTHGCSLPPRLLRSAIGRSPRQRHVHTLHGVSLDYLTACQAYLNWRCYTATLTEMLLSRYADHVIAVSKRTATAAQHYFALPAARITVIPNGHAEPPPRPNARADFRRRFKLDDSHFVAAFIGRGEDPVKGTATITTAMRQLSGPFDNLRLLAVPGSGFEPADWLIKTGPVEHSRMPDCYAAADVLVNCSLNEGLPLTVIEAMAAGLAVVASPVGGLPDLIRHNHSGLLLNRSHSNLADLLARLIHNPSFRTQLGANAHRAVKTLTWPDIARRTIALYDSLLPMKTHTVS